jgi:hypothetical protein
MLGSPLDCLRAEFGRRASPSRTATPGSDSESDTEDPPRGVQALPVQAALWELLNGDRQPAGSRISDCGSSILHFVQILDDLQNWTGPLLR